MSLICSIDRASISVAIVPMAEQYGWSDSAKGAISSSFFAGYTITNLIGKDQPFLATPPPAEQASLQSIAPDILWQLSCRLFHVALSASLPAESTSELQCTSPSLTAPSHRWLRGYQVFLQSGAGWRRSSVVPLHSVHAHSSRPGVHVDTPLHL